MTQTAPVVVLEETLVQEPAGAGGEGAAAAAMAQTAPGNVVPMVELPPSEEYGDSEDIDPVAAANAADWIAEFILAYKGVLEAGTSEGPRHRVDRAIIQSGVPSDFARAEREEGNA